MGDAVGFGQREGLVGAAHLGRDGFVADREIAHVQFVDRLVDRAGNDRDLGGAPGLGLKGWIREVEQHGVRRAGSQAHRVGVRHGVSDDRVLGRDVDGDLEAVGAVLPVRRSGNLPRAVRVARHGVARGIAAAARVIPQLQGDLRCRWCPQLHTRGAVIKGDADTGGASVARIQVIEHSRDLHAGEGDRRVIGNENLDRPGEGVLDLAAVHTGDREGDVVLQVREARELLLAQRTDVGQRGHGHVGASDLAIGKAHAAGGVVGEDHCCVGCGHGSEEVRGQHDRRRINPLGTQFTGAGGGRISHLDGQHVRGDVVGEGHVLTLLGTKGDVVSPGLAVGPVVLGPAEAVRDLDLVAASGDGVRGEGVGAVLTRRHEGGKACRVPVAAVTAGAPESLIEAAGQGDEGAVEGGEGAVADRVVVEGDLPARCGVREVRAIAFAANTVVFVPTAADRDLVFVAASRDIEGGGVPGRILVLGELGGFAVGLPVAGTSHGRVMATGDGNEQLIAAGCLGCGTGEVHADDTVAGGRFAVSGGIGRDGTVLDEGALLQRRGIGKDTTIGPGGDAERGVVIRADDAVGKGRLGPAIVRRIDRDRSHGVELVAREVEHRVEVTRGHALFGLVDDRTERRNRQACGAVGVRCQGARCAVDGGVRCPRGKRMDLLGDRRVGVVQRYDVFVLFVAVDARKCVESGAIGSEELDLSASVERGMLSAQFTESRDVAIKGRGGIEVIAGAVGRAVELVLARVFLRLGGKHRLAGSLVAAIANEALLIAVVDDGLAACEVHQGVREFAARLGVIGAAQEVADAPHIVIAEEGRQEGGVRRRACVAVIVGEQGGQPRASQALGVVDGT